MIWDGLREAREWATFGFAALGGVVACLNVRHRQQKERSGVEQRFSLDLRPFGADGCYNARLIVRGAADRRLRLERIEVARLCGLEIGAWSDKDGDGSPRSFPERTGRILVVQRDIDPLLGVGLIPEPDGLFEFACRVPSRPWYAARSMARLRISARFEEISSARRPSRIVLRSKQIPWKASNAAMAR